MTTHLRDQPRSSKIVVLNNEASDSKLIEVFVSSRSPADLTLDSAFAMRVDKAGSKERALCVVSEIQT